jgi:hypothetical protein
MSTLQHMVAVLQGRKLRMREMVGLRLQFHVLGVSGEAL